MKEACNLQNGQDLMVMCAECGLISEKDIFWVNEVSSKRSHLPQIDFNVVETFEQVILAHQDTC